VVLWRAGDRAQDLDRILEAARRAPSAGNQQAWDFVVCTDPEQLAQLAKVRPAAGHVAGSAATITLVALKGTWVSG
jgi:nitroreductase